MERSELCSARLGELENTMTTEQKILS